MLKLLIWDLVAFYMGHLLIGSNFFSLLKLFIWVPIKGLLKPSKNDAMGGIDYDERQGSVGGPMMGIPDAVYKVFRLPRNINDE